MSHLNWAQLQIDIQVYARHGAMQTGTGHVHGHVRSHVHSHVRSHVHSHVHSSATATLVTI